MNENTPSAALPLGSSKPAGTTQPPLMERVVKGAHDTIDRIAEHAAPHVARVEERVHGASDMLHERADKAKQVSQEWVDGLRGTVREHPLVALAAALAAGMLVASLMRSHDH